MSEMSFQPQHPADEDPRTEVLRQNGPFTEFEIEARQTGAWSEQSDAPKPSVVERVRAHASRRGGRAYSEPTDSELDPEMKDGRHLRTPEEIREVVERAERIRDGLRKTQALRVYEQDLAQATKPDGKVHTGTMLALARARDEKEKARKAKISRVNEQLKDQ